MYEWLLILCLLGLVVLNCKDNKSVFIEDAEEKIFDVVGYDGCWLRDSNIFLDSLNYNCEKFCLDGEGGVYYITVQGRSNISLDSIHYAGTVRRGKIFSIDSTTFGFAGWFNYYDNAKNKITGTFYGNMGQGPLEDTLSIHFNDDNIDVWIGDSCLTFDDHDYLCGVSQKTFTDDSSLDLCTSFGFKDEPNYSDEF